MRPFLTPRLVLGSGLVTVAVALTVVVGAGATGSAAASMPSVNPPAVQPHFGDLDDQHQGHPSRTAHRAEYSAAPAAKKRHSSGPTSWVALNHAIAKIPTYDKGGAKWIVRNTGWSATADWYNDVIYIAPSVPENRLYSVVAHEWSHILTVRAYGGSVKRAKKATRSHYGGTGLAGAERAADCMAILQDATWTAYTSCHKSRWRDGARRLLHGRHL